MDPRAPASRILGLLGIAIAVAWVDASMRPWLPLPWWSTAGVATVVAFAHGTRGGMVIGFAFTAYGVRSWLLGAPILAPLLALAALAVMGATPLRSLALRRRGEVVAGAAVALAAWEWVLTPMLAGGVGVIGVRSGIACLIAGAVQTIAGFIALRRIPQTLV